MLTAKKSMRESGRALGCLLMVILLAAVAGGAWFWWQSPERKFHGEWVMTGGALPVSTTIVFKSGGTYTSSTQVGGGGISASGQSTGTYKVNSSAKPPVLEMTTVSGSGFGTGVKPVSLPYQFLDNDTLQLETPGVLAFKLELKRKK